MPMVDMLCLANSRKHSGRCVAGLRLDTQQWVRPVADTSDGTLFAGQYGLADGTEPRPLDVVRLELVRPRPAAYHPEDWVIARRSWQLRQRPASQNTLAMLTEYLEIGPDLLGNSRDRLTEDEANAGVEASLALTEPRNVTWEITRKPTGRRQTRARFRLRGTRYSLAVSDPEWEARLEDLSGGVHPRRAAELPDSRQLLFTVSLTEPFEHKCYKLIAAVIVMPEADDPGDDIPF